jgi:transposase-like protein
MSVHADPGLAGAEVARRLNVTPQAVAFWWIGWKAEANWSADRIHAIAMFRSFTSLMLAVRFWAADDLVAEVEEQITQQLGPTNATRLRTMLERVADTALNG